jgi:hypothetical protein
LIGAWLTRALPQGRGEGRLPFLRTVAADTVWIVTSTPHDEDEHAASPGRRELAAAWVGLRQPVVIVLLLIAFFSSISGKPLDGLLMLIVAVGLAWDARRRSGQAAATVADAALPSPPRPSSWGVRRILAGLALLAAGVVYAVLVGSYIRFSWPATIFVVGLGVVVVAIGWHGPVRSRPDPGRLPRTGSALWFGVLLAGGVFEIWNLSQQPSLDTDSFAHPTISALSDPLLASHPGRSLMLGVWLLLGWYVVRR